MSLWDNTTPGERRAPTSPMHVVAGRNADECPVGLHIREAERVASVAGWACQMVCVGVVVRT